MSWNSRYLRGPEGLFETSFAVENSRPDAFIPHVTPRQ
jgi:hypothetical protein